MHIRLLAVSSSRVNYHVRSLLMCYHNWQVTLSEGQVGGAHSCHQTLWNFVRLYIVFSIKNDRLEIFLILLTKLVCISPPKIRNAYEFSRSQIQPFKITSKVIFLADSVSPKTRCRSFVRSFGSHLTLPSINSKVTFIEIRF